MITETTDVFEVEASCGVFFIRAESVSDASNKAAKHIGLELENDCQESRMRGTHAWLFFGSDGSQRFFFKVRRLSVVVVE